MSATPTIISVWYLLIHFSFLLHLLLSSLIFQHIKEILPFYFPSISLFFSQSVALMGSLCLHVGLCLFLMLSGCLGSLVFTLPTTFAVLQQPGQELQLEQGPCSAGALWLQGHEFGAVLSKGVMQGPSLKLGDRPSARI